MNDDTKIKRGPDGRFTKGVSGNSKGRPSGRKKALVGEASPIDIVLGQTWTLTTDGTTQELTTQQALEHQTFKRALDGDRRSIRTVLKWIKKREKKRDAIRRRHQRKNPMPIKQVYLEDVGGRSNDALLLLDIIEPYRPVPDPEVPDTFLIRPWAAQLAIGRHRRLKQLDDNDIKLIRCQVADAGELNLPGGVLGR